MPTDPLKPGPVRPLERDPAIPPPEDHSPFWLRIIKSLRPTASVEVNKRTGQRSETFGIKGGTDF